MDASSRAGGSRAQSRPAHRLVTIAQCGVEIGAGVIQSASRRFEPTHTVLPLGRLGETPHQAFELHHARLAGLRIDVAVQPPPGGGRGRLRVGPGRRVLGMTATIIAWDCGLATGGSGVTATKPSDVAEHPQWATHQRDGGGTSAWETATGSAAGTSTGAHRR